MTPRSPRRLIRLTLSFVLVSLLLTIPSMTFAASPGTVTGDKTLSISDIICDGSTVVTLTLQGETGIAGDPEDIMLVLDRSGSMNGAPLANLKTAANGEATFTYSNTEASSDTITATVPLQANVSTELTDTAAKRWMPIPARIDIKPGSDPNSYGAKAKGNIPVALLGSATFDVDDVDDSTVRFGDAPSPLGDASESHGKSHPEFFNADAFLDKIYHFEFPDTNLDPADTQGCLGGEINGLDFLGCDAVRIVPN